MAQLTPCATPYGASTPPATSDSNVAINAQLLIVATPVIANGMYYANYNGVSVIAGVYGPDLNMVATSTYKAAGMAYSGNYISFTSPVTLFAADYYLATNGAFFGYNFNAANSWSFETYAAGILPTTYAPTGTVGTYNLGSYLDTCTYAPSAAPTVSQCSATIMGDGGPSTNFLYNPGLINFNFFYPPYVPYTFNTVELYNPNSMATSGLGGVYDDSRNLIVASTNVLLQPGWNKVPCAPTTLGSMVYFGLAFQFQNYDAAFNSAGTNYDYDYASQVFNGTLPASASTGTGVTGEGGFLMSLDECTPTPTPTNTPTPAPTNTPTPVPNIFDGMRLLRVRGSISMNIPTATQTPTSNFASVLPGFGDSYTVGFDATPTTDSFLNIVGVQQNIWYPTTTTLNFGFSGQTSASYDSTWMAGYIASIAGYGDGPMNRCTLFFGINDILDPSGDCNSCCGGLTLAQAATAATNFGSNMQDMINQIYANNHGTKIVVCSVPDPSNYVNGVTLGPHAAISPVGVFSLFNQQVASLVSNNSVSITISEADLYTAMINHPEYYNNVDDIHFNNAGHAVAANLINANFANNG